jgi:hypothetical protein
VIFTDALRPPAPLDPTAPAYKDWLHLNVLDTASGAIGIFNVSLHGAPADARGRAIGTALLHRREQGWTGNLEVRGINEALLGPSFIGLARLGLAVVSSPASVLTSVAGMDGLDSATLTATAASRPVYFELAMPFGRGWISWNAIPLLRLEGTIESNGTRLDLSQAAAYHDHNWGRWHWGDDVGWEWGCFLAGDGSAGFVFARTTDRAHRCLGPAWCSVHAGDVKRVFPEASIECVLDGRFEQPLRRFPGALAALHQDRVEARLPATVRIRAGDGFDRIEIIFRARGAAQVIAADPVVPGYGFLHEMPGEFEACGRLNGQPVAHSGLAIFEYVD